ncbi:MAG: YybH family protein, partial [Rhizobacter sp.]
GAENPVSGLRQHPRAKGTESRDASKTYDSRCKSHDLSCPGAGSDAAERRKEQQAGVPFARSGRPIGVITLFAGQDHSPQERHMGTASKDFEGFMKLREAASRAFVNGDDKPLAEISTLASPATLFGPKGDCVQDAGKVNAANAEGAKRFNGASRNDFEVMHMASDENLAYWVGIQRSVVQVQGEDKPVPFDLRVTEIFRREGGQWKLVHRHADRLAPKSEA